MRALSTSVTRAAPFLIPTDPVLLRGGASNTSLLPESQCGTTGPCDRSTDPFDLDDSATVADTLPGHRHQKRTAPWAIRVGLPASD